MAIRFSTDCEALLKFPQLQPRRVTPEWFSRIPAKVDGEGIIEDASEFKTVRVCPGFTDLYDTAIMLPLWCTVSLTRCSADRNDNPVPDPDSLDVFSMCAPDIFQVEWHPAGQAVGMPGTFGMKALPKMVSPWWVETDEGWSIYITPATHHSRTLPFEPIAGIIHTDRYHKSHLPCRWTREPGSEETVFAGTPFAYIFPFKRAEAPKIEIRLLKDEKEKERLDVEFHSGEYRKKRKRD
ncbi:MAG: hypothetical protein WD407_11610 [Rhodospirillales bacterium]